MGWTQETRARARASLDNRPVQKCRLNKDTATIFRMIAAKANCAPSIFLEGLVEHFVKTTVQKLKDAADGNPKNPSRES